MLRRLFTGRLPVEEVRGQATTWGEWPGDGVSATTWAGKAVNRAAALQLLTVYGCVRLICDSIATLPVAVFRELADGSKQEIATPVWLAQPTVDLDFTAWCTQVLSSLLLDGNAYIAKMLSPVTGKIVELIPLDPSRVTVRRVNGMRTVMVDGTPCPFEVIHLKGAMLPGADVGMSPVEYARQSIGLGLATVEHGAKAFGRGMALSGVIEMPNEATPERMRDTAKQWHRKLTGVDDLPGVLTNGATWKPTSVTNEQAQFLQTRGFTSAEIAGQMFLVDPSDLGIGVAGSSLTYANLLERTTRRVQVTLLPWIVRLETALSSPLARPQYVKFNVDGLLRGDALQRWSVYESAARINTAAVASGMGPVMLTGEMRDFEDLGPLPTGPEVDPAGPEINENMVRFDGEIRARLEAIEATRDVVVAPNVTVNLPESRMDAPVVNVTMPEQPAQQVTVNVPEQREQPAPVVNVTVEQPPSRTVSRRVERDEAGQIVRIVEES